MTTLKLNNFNKDHYDKVYTHFDVNDYSVSPVYTYGNEKYKIIFRKHTPEKNIEVKDMKYMLLITLDYYIHKDLEYLENWELIRSTDDNFYKWIDSRVKLNTGFNDLCVCCHEIQNLYYYLFKNDNYNLIFCVGSVCIKRFFQKYGKTKDNNDKTKKELLIKLNPISADPDRKCIKCNKNKSYNSGAKKNYCSNCFNNICRNDVCIFKKNKDEEYCSFCQYKFKCNIPTNKCIVCI
jgi:hypothetical protein